MNTEYVTKNQLMDALTLQRRFIKEDMREVVSEIVDKAMEEQASSLQENFDHLGERFTKVEEKVGIYS